MLKNLPWLPRAHTVSLFQGPSFSHLASVEDLSILMSLLGPPLMTELQR